MYNLRFLTLRPPKESGGLNLIFFDYSIAFNEAFISVLPLTKLVAAGCLLNRLGQLLFSFTPISI